MIYFSSKLLELEVPPIRPVMVKLFFETATLKFKIANVKNLNVAYFKKNIIICIL